MSPCEPSAISFCHCQLTSLVALAAPPGLPTQPSTVTASAEERKAGKWSRENLQRAIELFHRDGLLVMDNIIDPSDLVKLRESMIETAKEVKLQKSDPREYNHGIKSNFLQAPPMTTPELLFPSVYQNPFLVQIAEAYLGSGLCMPFITANTALANTTERQPVHKDCAFVHPAAPFMIIANFLLSDFTPENGSTEVRAHHGHAAGLRALTSGIDDSSGLAQLSRRCQLSRCGEHLRAGCPRATSAPMSWMRGARRGRQPKWTSSSAVSCSVT